MIVSIANTERKKKYSSSKVYNTLIDDGFILPKNINEGKIFDYVDLNYINKINNINITYRLNLTLTMQNKIGPYTDKEFEEMENDWRTNSQKFFKEKYGLSRQKGIELFGPAEIRTKEQKLAYAKNIYIKQYNNQEEYHQEIKDQFTQVVEKQIEDIMNKLKISYKKARVLMSKIGYKSAMTARIEGDKIKYYAN